MQQGHRWQYGGWGDPVRGTRLPRGISNGGQGAADARLHLHPVRWSGSVSAELRGAVRAIRWRGGAFFFFAEMMND